MWTVRANNKYSVWAERLVHRSYLLTFKSQILKDPHCCGYIVQAERFVYESYLVSYYPHCSILYILLLGAMPGHI